MSYTDTGRAPTDTTQASGRRARPVRELRETKPSFKTTEYWAMVLGIAAIVVIYLGAADTSLNLWRATLLGTAVGIGYIVSRGIAKAGSHADRSRDRDDIDLRTNR